MAVACVAAASERLELPYGITRKGVPLSSAIDPSLLDTGSPFTRVLVIAGAETDPGAARATQALADSLRGASETWRSQFPDVSISVIAAPYPDGAVAAGGFPPAGRAYDDATHAEMLYLWRWVGMLAPDVVIELRAGPSVSWGIPSSSRELSGFARTRAPQTGEVDVRGLATALASHAVSEVAPIPALALTANSAADLVPLLDWLQRHKVRSPAREELLRRRSRGPVDVARDLSRRYGRQLDEVTYIPALALVGRLRLGDLTGDVVHRGEVERLVEPYRAGVKSSLLAVSTGSQQAGHLLFGELAEITGNRRYVALLRQAADLGFDEKGGPREAMPSHAEMSDAIFLGTPLLAQTARLTGESKYRDVALRHVRTLVKLNLRPDGLHRHSPVAPDQTAWGRGNGFVVAGLALTLSEWPEEDAAFQELLALYRAHVAAMMPHQDVLGLWHQVIDHPESYREYTATCMTAFAIARGLRRGWLDCGTFEPVVQRAWRAILQRTASDGGLVDVCTGTGKMKSLREYLDRPAILGADDRGGAMALLVCTELAYAEREGKLSLK